MIIAVDFDGTLHTGSWPGIGAPKPGAKDVMWRLKDDGHYIIIWTCREGEYRQDMIKWLRKNDIPFDTVNEHRPGSTDLYGYVSRKVYAHLYIDDRQVGGLPPWDDIYVYVRIKENEYNEYQQLLRDLK